MLLILIRKRIQEYKRPTEDVSAIANIITKPERKITIYYLIQINHHLDSTTSPVYYLDIYLQLNMFRASSRLSSGAQQLQ
jgi:hypothetical protein